MAHKIADTIVALASGAGRAAVAVIRISGPHTRSVLEAICGGAPPPPARRAALRRLHDPRDGALIDRGLVLWFPGPASFTGEDVAELQVHGSRAVVQAIIDAVLSLPGMRLAEPGEFARRAFESGRLDLTEVEGLADLVQAETEAQRRQALAQSEGSLMRLYESWRGELLKAQALVEAGLDFADEADVATDVSAKSDAIVADLLAAIVAHLADRRGERLRDGVCVVIAGPPNVGKSSLLNALARRDVAIVSEEAGTTRDVIEVHLDLGGIPVILSDTAGIREAEGRVEAAGIDRALARVEDADIVLWLADATDPARTPIRRFGATKNKDAPTCAVEIAVMNKLDLAREAAAALPEGALAISAKTGEGLDLLMARLETEAEIRGRAGDRRAADDPGTPSDRARSRKGRARPL